MKTHGTCTECGATFHDYPLANLCEECAGGPVSEPECDERYDGERGGQTDGDF